jgi:UDP-N-acetylglucosamine--N-acetylmuramyl-(pentapeptide) pyrophosphoryl-undecaprenol N-acetylglucosamine transferase
MPLRVAITGGLTGGHVLPGITLALALATLGHEVRYIGGRGQLEEAMAGRYGVAFRGFSFQRYGPWRRRLSVARGTCTVLPLLARERPDVLFCTGSLTGIPAVLAARALGVPVVLHESDVVPGSETRWLAVLSRRVCVGFEPTATHFRRPTVVTGNLTRPNFAGGSRAACLRRYGLPDDRPVVFVVGGSQGAATLNDLVVAIVPELVDSCSVIHACGVGKLDRSIRYPGYVPLEFVHDEIRDIYAASDLVVCRAGAGAIEEACAYRVPALYVPYPWAEANHQEHNARTMAAAGVADVLPQPGLTPDQLLVAIHRMLAGRAAYVAGYERLVRPPALRLLCEVVLREARPLRRVRRPAGESPRCA